MTPAPVPTDDEASETIEDLKAIAAYFENHRLGKLGIQRGTETILIGAACKQAIVALSRIPSEEATEEKIVLPDWDSLPVSTRIQIVKTAYAKDNEPSSLEYYEAIREVLGRITRTPEGQGRSHE